LGIASDPGPSKRRQLIAAGIMVLAWFALALQLYLTIAEPVVSGVSVLGRIANYFSFFTILTNLLVAIALTLFVAFPRIFLGQFFSRPTVQSAIAVYIAVVGAIYSLLLRHQWNPQGLGKLADGLLHDAVPVLYGIYWLVFVPKAQLRWKHALLWLIYPVAYMFYTVARGAATGWYPYPFIDVAVLGYAVALRNATGVLLVFIVAGLLAVAIGRWMTRRSVRSA
jgi:hypothetical protein